MIVDQNLRLTSPAITTASTYYSDAIDLSQAREIGEGEDIYAFTTITTAFTGGTNVTFDVVVADNAALTTNTTVVASHGTVVTASLTAKAQFVTRINPVIGTLGRRYLGIRYTTTGTYSTGVALTDFPHDIQDGKKFYASGFSVAS